MSYLPPVLVNHSITVNPGHTVIDLVFNKEIERGSGSIIVTDGALQTVIDRATGLPTTRIVGATDTWEIPLNQVDINDKTASINADGLLPDHNYRVFILPGVLQSNGQPFAGVSNGNLLTFTTPDADTTPPGLVGMTLDNWSFNTGHPTAQLSLVFTEKVAAFSASALHGTGLTFGAPTSTDGIHWQVAVTAQAGVDVSNPNLTLDMTRVKDLSGNASVGNPFTSYNIDTKLPTVSSVVLNNATPALSSGATVTITFSETVQTLASSAIVAPHAIVGTPTSTDGGITWVATLSPAGGGTSTGNQLHVDLTRVADLAGNAGTGSFNAPATYAVDADAPTAAITLSGNRVSQKGSVEVTVVFSEAVKSVPLGAFTVPNAQISSALTSTDNGITWKGTLSTNANINAVGNVLKLDMSQVQDLSGNAGSGFAQADKQYDVDVTPPTASLSLTNTHLTSTAGATLTIQFSEPVATPSLSWFTTPHASLSNLTKVSPDGSIWSATLTPSGTGTSTGNQVSLDMSLVHDLANNNGSGTVTTASYDTDVTASTGLPTITAMVLDGDSGGTAYNPERATDFITNIDGFSLEGTLSSALTGDQTLELTIGSQQVTAHVSGTHWYYYQPTLAPDLPDGSYTITGRVVDGTSTGTAFTKTLVLDTTTPHATSPTQNSTQDVNQDLVITFDEPVSWHGIMDSEWDNQYWHDEDNFVKLVHNGITEWVYIDNRNLSDGGRTLTIPANDLHLASGAAYTLELRQSGADYVSITDTAGNFVDYSKIAFTTTGTRTDTTAPVVLAAMATQQGAFGIGQQIEIQIKFSEPVKAGSEWPELTLNNGGKATYQTAIDSNRTMLFRYVVDQHDNSGYLDLDGIASLLQNLTDLAGNPLASTTVHMGTLLNPQLGSMVVVDTSIPPTISSAPVLDATWDSGVKGDLLTNADPRSFHGAGATPGMIVSLYDLSTEGGPEIGHATANGDGTWNITLDSTRHLSEGTHNLAVGQYNTNGNFSADLSPSMSLIIDRTADAIVAELDANSDGGVIRDWKTAVTTPTLNLTGVESGATVTILDGATPLTVSSTVGGDGTWHVTLPTLATGVHHLHLSQTDAAGNVSAVYDQDLTIDPAEVIVTAVVPPAKLAAPLLSSIDSGSSASDGITKVNTLAFTGSDAVANATIDLLKDGVVFLTGTANASGVWSLAPPSALADGTYSFTVRQTDSGSHTSSASDPLSITIDTTGPSKLNAPVLAAGSDSGASNSDRITNVTKPEFTGAGAEPGARIELWEGSTMLKSGTADEHGAWSITLTSTLIEDTHAISVVQVDAAGNASAASDATNVTIDVTAPSVAGDWTRTVHIGQQFQMWFSEAIVHSNASTFANVYDNVAASLLHISTGTSSNWTDNVNHNGITTSAFRFTPVNGGWVEVAFTGVEDLAGNAITDTTPSHYEFTVDLSGTSFFLPFPAL